VMLFGIVDNVVNQKNTANKGNNSDYKEFHALPFLYFFGLNDSIDKQHQPGSYKRGCT
jgi:hypothetical protein